MGNVYFDVVKLSLDSKSRIRLSEVIKKRLEISSDEITAYLGECFLIIPRQTKKNSEVGLPTELPKIDLEG